MLLIYPVFDMQYQENKKVRGLGTKQTKCVEQKQYSGWRQDHGWRDRPTSLPNWTFHFGEEKKWFCCFSFPFLH